MASLATRQETLTGQPSPARPERPVNVNDRERLMSTLLGGMLALLGLRRGGMAGFGVAALGGILAYRGLTGHCDAYEALGLSSLRGHVHPTATDDPEHTRTIQRTMTIHRPRAELYAAWRDLKRLPRYVRHLARAEFLPDQTSHWVIRLPAGAEVEWYAEIVEQQENERIVWHAIEPTDVPHIGSVSFRDAPGNRGTEVSLSLTYNPPAGRLGEALISLWGESPEQLVSSILRRFKQQMETGEILTVEGQPSGREEEALV